MPWDRCRPPGESCEVGAGSAGRRLGPHSLHRLHRILREDGIDPTASYISLYFPYIPMIFADFRSLMYTIDEAQRLFPNAVRLISGAGERQFRAMAFGIANDFD